jgi:CDP-diacylglycerol--serine O-phosphatidyltransferase
MLKSLHNDDDGSDRPKRVRRRRLRSIAMLPTLLTLGNLFFGFAAIYQCTRETEDIGGQVLPATNRTLESDFFEARAPSYLAIACWMLLGSMICDALDGRIARMTKRASKFGEELDSLADIVSFGVAPALMMATLIRREMKQLAFVPFGFERFGQVALFIGLIYACCAALRLARFNAETSLDESSHRGFKGMPSPGAAGAIISAILLHDHLDHAAMWPWFAGVLTRLLPLLTLCIALLMVSRVPYTHAASSFLGRRPLWHVVLVLLLIPVVIMYTELMLFLAAWAFVVSGPVTWVLRRGRPQPAPAGFPVVTDEPARDPSSMES